MNTKYVYPNVFMSREYMDRLSVLMPDIVQYINECRSRWIMNGCTDKDWNDYISKLDAYGLEEYLSIFQKYLDSYYEELTGFRKLILEVNFLNYL